MALTPQGLVIKTQPEIQALLEQSLSGAFPKINIKAGPIQQVIAILSEELAIIWEQMQAIDANQDPDRASGFALDQLMALTGSVRRPASKSRVTASVTLDAGKSVPAGSIAAVQAEPDNQFVCVATVTNAALTTEDVDAVFEALNAGPIPAPAGRLTVIVTPVSGWSAITNVLDAALGQEVATDAEARLQRIRELAGGGRRTIASIRSALARVTNVLQVQVYENVTLITDGDGRPGKSIEAVIWDGGPGAADDDVVAQTIWNKKPEGIESFGAASDSGTAVDDEGAEHVVAFTRATSLRTYVAITAILRAGTGAGWQDDVKAAVAARDELYTVGETAYASQLVTAIIDAVPSIVAIPALTLGIAPSPVGASVVPNYYQIIGISTGDITVGT